MEEINQIIIKGRILSNKNNENCFICKNILDKAECGECQIRRGEIILPENFIKLTTFKSKKEFKLKNVTIPHSPSQNGPQPVGKCDCKNGKFRCRNVNCRRKLCGYCSVKCLFCHLHFCKSSNKNCVQSLEEHKLICRKKNLLKN
jgi:hypothetical protein